MQNIEVSLHPNGSSPAGPHQFLAVGIGSIMTTCQWTSVDERYGSLLWVSDIKLGASNILIFQGIDDILSDNQAAAADVDNESTLLHVAERLGIDHALAVGVEWQAENQNVGLFEELRSASQPQRRRPHGAEPCDVPS